MKSMTKRTGAILATAALATAFAAAGTGILIKNNMNTFAAEENGVPSSVYYYDNLTDATGKEYTLAKKFYNALDEMNKSGDFKDGEVDYSLSEVLQSSEIEKWVIEGDLTIPKAFSAARDSYYYDHPELFYIDIYKLTISAGRSNGVYSAYIDCGREANCYIDDGFKNENEVNNAIDAFNVKVNEVITYAQTEADKTAELAEKESLLATFANTYIAEHVNYDYDAYYEYLEEEGEVYAGSFTYNAYGALVLGKSVCGGFARAYKAVLDKLEIPCVVVSGYSLSKSGDGKDVEVGEAHSWNYVWLKTPSDDGIATLSDDVDGGWYAYDVTWNSARENANSYVNMNAFANGRVHVSDPVVSSSNYEMPYPELSQNSYGNTTVNNEFMHSFTYSRDTSAGKDGLDDFGNPFMTKYETVSYMGKGATLLLEEGIHIIYRYYYENKDGEMQWTAWSDLGNTDKLYQGMLDQGGKSTVVPVDARSLYSQYAVVDVEADLNASMKPVQKPDTNVNIGDTLPIYYSPDYKTADGKDLGEHTLYISEVYVNKTYGTYMPAPYITKSSPAHTGTLVISDNMAVSATDTTMADKYTFTLNVTYDEKLHVLDESKPIGINYVSEFSNIYEHSSLVPFESGEYVRLSNDGYTLSFRFKPSLMYEHNSILYSFYFDNVGSTKSLAGRMSDKAPNPVHYHFARNYTTCPQILGGGRLWVDCCAQPTLVSNSDLSVMDFKDEDGNSTFSEQARSQMMLVVDSVKPETENQMLEGIDKNFGIKEKDIKTSETYDINLQICGKYPKIPDGSYVKIALGFPQGYGPENEGVTFKLYHRKHIKGDEYIIEEIPCVVTQLGIVATVTSFSPYMVAVVDGDKVSTNKTILASIDGKGGTLSKADGQIQSVAPGKSYTYSITPDEGYKIYKVTLNGEEVTEQIGSDGKLTLTYDNLLNNNELEIQYISEAAAQRYEAKDVEMVDPVKVVVSTDGESSIAIKGADLPINQLVPANNSATLWIVLGCVFGVLIIGCAVGLGVLIVKKKKAKE